MTWKEQEEIKRALVCCDDNGHDCGRCPYRNFVKWEMDMRDALAHIIRLEAERVEVVRCRECMYWRRGADSTVHWVCTQHSQGERLMHTMPDFYCADGFREVKSSDEIIF